MTLGRTYYKDPSGNPVSVIQYDTRGDIPVYDVEIVNRLSGEVIEYFDNVLGQNALDSLAHRRLWEKS